MYSTKHKVVGQDELCKRIANMDYTAGTAHRHSRMRRAAGPVADQKGHRQ